MFKKTDGGCTPAVAWWIAIITVFAWTAGAFGQEPADSSPAPTAEPAVPPAGPPPTTGPWAEPPESLDYDSEPPYDFYERSWRYRMRQYRGSRYSRDYDYYAPSGRYRGPYYRPWGSPVRPHPDYDYAPPAYRYAYPPPDDYYRYPGDAAFDEGYYQGHRDGKEFAEWSFQYELGTRSYLKAMEAGVRAFQASDYSLASRQFVLAAQLNQGDAAARLHAAHALVALGRYDEAALSVRRALQLQPKLVFLPLDIRGDYGRIKDFDEHTRKLREAAAEKADKANLWFLLGYWDFFSGRADRAHLSLQKADTLDPENRTTLRMLDAVRLSTPAEPERAVQPAPPSSPKPGAKPGQPGKTIPAAPLPAAPAPAAPKDGSQAT
ncbi:MAG: hypothetical protein JXB13_09735 [Phycisphaerae bacterium]|nr:hypothetical protein [Phycisphaerae bacterium]